MRKDVIHHSHLSESDRCESVDDVRWMGFSCIFVVSHKAGQPGVVDRELQIQIWGGFPSQILPCFSSDLPSFDFPSDAPEGAAILAKTLPGILNTRFPNEAKPRVVFTDRGRGFYGIHTKKITAEFKEALEEEGFRAFNGDDASAQPGSMGDVMPHETAVSWLRKLLEKSLPAAAWEESRENYAVRLRDAASHVNANYEVGDLCKCFLDRVDMLIEKKGDRLSK